jgi:hypothetical protein
MSDKITRENFEPLFCNSDSLKNSVSIAKMARKVSLKILPHNHGPFLGQDHNKNLTNQAASRILSRGLKLKND